jgi:RNA-directed DNA polymerase
LDAAYKWLCKQRQHYPANSDIWSLRFSWTDHKEELLQTINRGDYVFAPVKKITKANGNTIHLWNSQDALVMKLMAEMLKGLLNLSKQFTHVKGHGGLKRSVV